jgi:hypothetical protein
MLEPIEHATKLLSASSYCTHGDVRFCFLSILEDLETHYNNDEFTQPMIANSTHHKLEEYWPFLDTSSQISSILDPRCKLSAFKEGEREDVKNLILQLSLNYEVPLDTLNNKNNNNARDYFFNLRQKNSTINTTTSNIVNSSTNDSQPSLLSELNRYLTAPLELNIDPLQWWNIQKSEYPILNNIARDFLSVQATSVASEQAFSIAGQVISPQRNRLDPQTARAILCLKSWMQNKIISK